MSECFFSQEAIFELSFASVSKRGFVQNQSFENVFPYRFFFHAPQPQFLIKDFAARLVLKQRSYKITRR